MGTYYGKISGIGNPTERINEITADDLATLRYFQIGLDYGVINREGYNFSIKYEINTSSVEVGKGIMFAYGYLGYIDKCVLEFIRPAISQYHIIYVELDRSKIPNTCILKVKNNQSSTSIERTFRQDYLDKVRTGVFQLPLWRVKVGSNGVEEVVDLRILRDKPKQVEYAPNCKSVFVDIYPSVTAVTQPTSDSSEKIATTLFVHKAVRKAIDGKPPNDVEEPTCKVSIRTTNGGTTNETELIFYRYDYNVEKKITISPNSGYSIAGVSSTDENVTIRRSGNLCYISLKKFKEENYTVLVAFIMATAL